MHPALKTVFFKYASPLILAGGVMASVHGSAPMTDNTPQEWEPVGCQRLDEPLSQSDIDQRGNTIAEMKKRIDALKGKDGTARTVENLEREKTQLGIFNFLDRLRLSLTDYGDWKELTDKLRNNGIAVDSVCIRGYQYLDSPAVLHENGDGTASLDINFYASSKTPTNDGHEVVSITSLSLDDISSAIEDVSARAVRFAALSGTSPDKAPLLNKTLSAEDLALILTLWQAQAAAEEILHAADTFARTEDDGAFAAVREDYPYLSGLIDDARTKTAWAIAGGESLSKEDRITFRQLAAQTMLNMPEIRQQVYESLLGEMENMAESGSDLTRHFNHKMTAREMNTAIARLDESFAQMPVQKIYDRWRGGGSDPAQDVIDQMERLRDPAP